jgi:subtilisin family serine protease
MQKLTNHTCRHLFIALMFTGAIFCICPTSALLGQQARTPIYSEATIDLINGIRKSRLINVKFKQNVLPLVAGASKGTTAQISSAFPNVISFFATLEQRYGPAVFYKKIPQATWGDVWRRHKITGNLVQVPDLSQLFAVQFPQSVPMDSIVAELEKLADVEYAYPPVQAISFVQPNDPCYNNFLNCDGTAPVSDQWNLKRIDAEQAWDITQGSSSIVVAIIDPNLFNRNHPDLDSKFTLNGDLDSTPNAPQHGTQVAGVVASETNNGQGIASLGWNLKMGTYNFQSTIYEDEQGPNSLEYEIVRATNDDVDIINCSFGTTTTVGNCVVSQSYLGVRDAIANAILQGIIVVAATGNGDENAGKPECSSYFPFTPFPAFYDFVIGVTATDLNDNHPAGYNYEGPIVIDPFIDVAAPGWQIPTTGGSGYGAPNGTSFAAPHVAALVGLMKSINSSLDKVAITDILTNTAEKVGQYAYVNGRNEHLGSGRINAYQALLLTHAYANKSVSSTATAQNNGRRLVKTSDGKYHLVFGSGITSGGNVLSEIFYRNYDGTNWSTPIRLSAGNEQNRFS